MCLTFDTCYPCKRLYNYLYIFMEKYSDQHDPCDIREGNDGKVGCKTVEYTKASPVL